MAKKKNKKDKNKKPKKKFGKLKIFGGVAFFVGLIVWYGMQPLKGTIHVGICRTFAELKLEYPFTLKVVQAETFERSQRVYYTYHNGFGQQKSDLIDCRFANDFAVPDYTIEKITINRVPMPQEEVTRFNQSIPGILASKPDLVVPFPMGDDLKKLRAPD